MKLSIYLSTLFIGMSLMFSGCADDLDTPYNGEIIEGRPASISISTNVGNMTLQSRANMQAGKDKEISSIWLGFFNSNGQLAYKFTFGEQTPIGSPDSDFRTLGPLDITSGNYYIAAVANPVGNYGVMYGDGGTTEATELITLLNRDDLTFDDFKNIAYRRGSGNVGSIGTPTGNLPMQGVFVPTANENHPITSDRADELTNTLTYVAPTSGGTSRLNGSIHFRRLISQNNFNITYNSDKIKSFEIVRAQIYNIPAVSWLAERKDGHSNGQFDDTNAGDYVDIIGKTAANSETQAEAQANYMRSPSLLSADFRKIDGGYQFDWWQLENRRHAVDGLSSYSQRENERKYPDGRNTGIYTALVGEEGEISANNCATYVQLEVKMEMAPGATSSQLGDNSQMTSVDALYTIHLGYCEGDATEKLMDFNCRRNSKYTYNVKVENIDKIIVEAINEDSPFEHGAEGTVTFVTTKYFESDAHYSAYNISLSNNERKDARWQLRVYTGPDSYIDINSDNFSQYAEKYYNWIELRPTSGENVLAPYKPYTGSGATSTNSTFRLTDLNDIAQYPAYNNATTLDDTQRWYTVFVNEYVYEDEFHSNTSANWQKYVNLPARIFWLKVEEHKSTDAESVIINSKYAIRQQSIHSFYSTSTTVNGIIFGTEHVNELENIPLRMHSTNFSSTELAYDARQLNYTYFGKVNSDRVWNTYISGFDSGTAPLMANGVETGVVDVRNAGGFTATHHGGSSNVYSESRGVADACLNRNRDLNGNGTIDANEVRWIVPKVDQYVRMVLGTASMPKPLINFSDYTKDPWNNDTDYDIKSAFHYASIDQDQLWAEEGVSTGWIGGCSHPQKVRCIRYLGNDMSDMTPASSDYALVVEKLDDENVIRFLYSDEILRDFTAESLPVHKVRENTTQLADYNRPYKYMEYKPDDDLNLGGTTYTDLYNSYTTANWFEYLTNNNPCDKYNVNGEQGWRVPNQVELMSILNVGQLSTRGEYLTCTKEYFSSGRVMGVIGNSDTPNHGAAFDVSGSGYYIKCVRDIIR